MLLFEISTGTDEHCNSIYDRRQKALYGYGACFDQPAYDYTYHNFFCQDGLTWEESQVGNWLQPVFKDGKPLRIYTLDEVRKNLHEGNF